MLCKDYNACLTFRYLILKTNHDRNMKQKYGLFINLYKCINVYMC